MYDQIKWFFRLIKKCQVISDNRLIEIYYQTTPFIQQLMGQQQHACVPQEAQHKVATKQSAPQRVKSWFVQLSFWKKIIIIFTLNTLILLILTDAIMLVLFGKISEDIINISNLEKEEFNTASNTQIAAATAKMTLTKIDLYGAILNQLANAYYYFNANPNIYTSLETFDPPFPLLTTDFNTTNYSQPGIYYYLNKNQSSFTPLPYLDQLLGKLIRTPSQIQNIKRVNIYVNNSANSNDVSVRTVPGTNQFTIPSINEILARFTQVPINNFTISTPYLDVLTTSASKDYLIALRTILNTSSAVKIYLEIELYQSVMFSSLKNIYYFPSTIISLVQQVNSQYIFYTDNLTSSFTSNVHSYYPIGTSRISVSGQEYVTASVGLSNQFTLGKYSVLTNSTSDPIRCVVFVRTSEIQKPAIEIQQFLNNQSSILKGIVFCWSFIILLSTVALATVVGNYIFSNLKMLSTKMEEYIKDPSKFHLIVIELKELQLKGILKKLSDNLIGIIEKIQVRKRQRKDRINQNYHPLSVGEPKFQQRQQLNDFEIIEEIKEQVRLKVEAMKKEAQQKQKAEKEKAEKEGVKAGEEKKQK